jgi:hypothetical protein
MPKRLLLYLIELKIVMLCWLIDCWVGQHTSDVLSLQGKPLVVLVTVTEQVL